MGWEAENPMVLSDEDLSIVELDRYEGEAPEEDIECCGCGYLLDFESEDIVESDLWEDDFLHNDLKCKIAYYAKENAKLVGSKAAV